MAGFTLQQNHKMFTLMLHTEKPMLKFGCLQIQYRENFFRGYDYKNTRLGIC